MNKIFKNVKQGFTLVELLIVIIIIAVLAGVVLVALNPAEQRYRAMLTTMKSNVASACNAQAVCAVDQDLSACITFSATTVDMTNPYAVPDSVNASSATCDPTTTPCMGFNTASPYNVAASVTVDTVDFDFTCHNAQAVANRGVVTCTPDAGTRTCTTMRVE